MTTSPPSVTAAAASALQRVRQALRDAGYDELVALPGWEDATEEVVGELLGGFADFVDHEIAPLDAVGDRQGSRLDPGTGRVLSPDGFRGAYEKYVAGQWQTVPLAAEHGGGGLPWSVGVAMADLFAAANVSLSLCPMLTQSACELLARWGRPDQQARYLSKLVTGQWTGTMVLTEPEAGSDVGAVRTMARPAAEGTWRLSGTKIFITWGDHDLAENIVHLVLARTPGAPPGTRGLSLFAVPARLVGPDGALGEQNAVRCVSIERKLGIHASPTCTLAFEEATGELIGEEHGGIRAMFTMMNTARLAVGTEGVGLAERALQMAVAYAGERRQGRLPGYPPDAQVAVVEHPDVRRMLATMRALTDAARSVVYAAAHAFDLSRRHPDPERRRQADELVAFLVPVAKAWPTDLVNEVTSLAIQIHGGAGFVEDTGVAQVYRDARITSIYEGTNGIQAIDLVQRKLSLDPGRPARWLVDEVHRRAEVLRGDGRVAEADALGAMAEAWWQAAQVVAAPGRDPLDVLAGASPFLAMTGGMLGGWLLAGRSDPADVASTRFFLTQLLPRWRALLPAVQAGAEDLAW